MFLLYSHVLHVGRIPRLRCRRPIMNNIGEAEEVFLELGVGGAKRHDSLLAYRVPQVKAVQGIIESTFMIVMFSC